MKLALDKWSSHLRGALAPGYLISGDDTLRVNETLDSLRQRARTDGFSGREVHFIERVSQWDEIRQSVAALSLFAERRIIELRPSKGKIGPAGAALLQSMLHRAVADQLLIVVTERLDGSTASGAWVKAFVSQGVWLPIWDLRREELPAWIAQRCRRAGLKAGDDAVQLLIDRVEGNMLAAQQEIDKLALLMPGATLDAAAVSAAVSDSARFTVFKLGEAALQGDAPRALRILAGLRSEGVEPALILWSLVRELRNLWHARANGGAPPKWSPQGAALGIALRRTARFPFARLATRASRADRMIKGRLAGDAWDELLLLTSEFCGVRTLPLSPTSRH